MNFCSIDFLFIFLPLFVILHAVLKGKMRNALLFLGSMVFYLLASGKLYEWSAFLLISVAANYFFGLLISMCKGKERKAYFGLGVLFNVIFLVFFKYSDIITPRIFPFLAKLSGQTDSVIPTVLLPLGISFYTFKALSYLREVYSEDVKAERSLIDFGAYLTAFPQISMGPIQKYKDFKPYLEKRTVNLSCVSSGLYEFIIGFGLKKIIADRLGGVWGGIETIGYDCISTPLAWLGIISFAIQLYFDFYGYSLMSSGIGQMLGYNTPKNFDYPYISKSMTEFWRRWHITLGDWFKENIYFPLGGSRCSKIKHIRNLFAVWFLTGIWHGSTAGFVAWGIFLFVLVSVEKTGKIDLIIKNKLWSRVYMFFAVIFSWMLFKLPTLGDFGTYFLRLFPFAGSSELVNPSDFVKYLGGVWYIILVGIIFATPIPRRIYEKIKNKDVVVIPILLIVFWYSVYLAVCGANDPFLYFNF